MGTILEAIVMARRNLVVSVTCCLAVFFSSFVFGVVSASVLGLSSFADKIGEQTCIEAYFRQGLTKEQTDFLMRAAETIEGVDYVKFVSSEDAVERLSAEGTTANILMDMDLLGLVPSSMEVRVKSAKDVRIVASILEKYDDVDFVRFGDEIAEQAISIVDTGKTACFALLALLATCTVLSVAATTVLMASGKVKDMETLRLLGADRWFLARPFVTQGALLGCAGAILACFALKVFFLVIMSSFPESSFILSSFAPASPFGFVGFGMALVGGLSGAVGAWVSISFSKVSDT